jgi:hypothetical protein
VFDAAAPGLPVEDFEDANVAAGGVVTFSDPLDSTSSNAVFAPGDVLLGSAPVVMTAGSSSFFGVINDSGPLTRIRIDDGVALLGELVDDVAFGTVPEPATLLVGVGVGAGARRLRRARRGL